MGGDGDRTLEIAFLRDALSKAIAARSQLQEELVYLAAHVHEIRAAVGNPFYYSHPEEPDEGIENYTGNRSHGIGLQTLFDYMRLEKQIGRLTEQLNAAERVEP